MAPDTRVDEIIDDLRKRILAGDFGTMGRLPSLRMLASQFKTTQETMNKVVQHLQAEGLLSSLGRQGLFVSMPRTRIPGIVPRFDLYLKEMGLEPVEHNIDSPSIVPAPPDIAKAMGVKPGNDVVHRARKQGTTTDYYRIAENFYPVDLAGGEILKLMQDDERADVLLSIKLIHGRTITHIHEDVVGRLPTTQEQETLKISRNTPILEVTRTNFDETNFVVMVNRIIFVASRFVLSYDYPVKHWS